MMKKFKNNAIFNFFFLIIIRLLMQRLDMFFHKFRLSDELSFLSFHITDLIFILSFLIILILFNFKSMWSYYIFSFLTLVFSSIINLFLLIKTFPRGQIGHYIVANYYLFVGVILLIIVLPLYFLNKFIRKRRIEKEASG